MKKEYTNEEIKNIVSKIQNRMTSFGYAEKENIEKRKNLKMINLYLKNNWRSNGNSNSLHSTR